ncbi:hypothetical protein [Micromonospora sp. bgisy143]|uniref:hypothetical protein n=1 Tax=Micromonospora sp. bgisy143 TaxID=3413790 RepID=UPI003EBFC6AF
MNVVTGRRAARDHDERPIVPGPAPRPDAASRPSPTPRPPTPTPARPSPAAPTPSPARPHPPGPSAETPPPGSYAGTAAGSAARADGEPGGAATVEVEPTTGAPVDAVPRRVPVRQQGRGRDAYRSDGTDLPDGDSAFWAPIEEVHWDGTPVREDSAPRASATSRRATARTTALPDPVSGLAALVLLSLVTAFFAWVSAGPFWLAVGHGRDGTVVIDTCTGAGLTQRCRGIFTADDGRFLAHGVRVSGVPAGGGAPGTAHRARMTGPDGGTAYADTGASRHLRWLPGLLVVLGCAAGIVRWTGSARLPGRRHRRWAVTAALAGPSLITLGFLAAAW